MNKISIEDVAEAVRAVNTRRFNRQVDKYLVISKQADQSLSHPDLSAKASKNKKKIYDEIQKEASDIRSHSVRSVSYLINFSFKINGHNERTQFYFKKIKKHQIELVSAIADEVEIIHDMVDRSKTMQAVIKKHAQTIQWASGFMDIMHERIVQRPTTLMRLQGPGKKIERLNQTIESMKAYEDGHAQDITSEECLVDSAFSTYHNLAQQTYAIIDQRKTSLESRAKELRQGEKLLLKLATKGYSFFMRKNLDGLLATHDVRTREFQEIIRESRQTYFNNN